MTKITTKFISIFIVFNFLLFVHSMKIANGEDKVEKRIKKLLKKVKIDKTKNEAFEELVKIGERAYPYIRKLLKREDSKLILITSVKEFSCLIGDIRYSVHLRNEGESGVWLIKYRRLKYMIKGLSSPIVCYVIRRKKDGVPVYFKHFPENVQKKAERERVIKIDPKKANYILLPPNEYSSYEFSFPHNLKPGKYQISFYFGRFKTNKLYPISHQTLEGEYMSLFTNFEILDGKKTGSYKKVFSFKLIRSPKVKKKR